MTTQTKQALKLFWYNPDVEVELVKIKTKGDYLATHNLQAIAGRAYRWLENWNINCVGNIDLLYIAQRYSCLFYGMMNRFCL